ncbi:ATP-binding protein [Haloimpatiens massiliensis]|uniref:ATP-binding protein n=1 Tax=Haloimpatiens massiliensis TaxID=1658110 RepID=UPI000C867F0F|nr:ATP-binding protein [Haloimpatiens massiliensis]
MSDILIPYGGEAVEAEYKEQMIMDYRGNPLIEALPHILSKEEVIEKLLLYPPYSSKEKLLEPHYRVHVVQRLFQCFQPLGIHIDLESRISRVIRQGYLARNPFKPEFVSSLNEGYDMIQNVNKDLSSNKLFRTTASGFTIIGVSGMGKTTAINRVLSIMPQIIIHCNYKGINFSMYQLIWLKLDCPFDGSIKGLCVEFFSKVDSLLGTNYYMKYGSSKRTVDTLLAAMSQIARSIGLGVLVIDEIQHLSEAKSGGSHRMLNFFVTLVNTIGVPVILIGTTKAISVLQSEFRQARRGSGQGDMIWERMKKDDNWSLLMEGLWDYQWTKKETAFSEEINNALYEESQGIIDIAVKLYAMSQIRAIMSGKEEVTVDLIKSVASENLKLVKPMLNALKSGDVRKIAKYEDICAVDFEEFFTTEKQNSDLNNRIKELQSLKKEKQQNVNTSKKEEAIIKLLELDIEPKTAKIHVDNIMKEHGEKLAVKEIIFKTLQKISKDNSSNKRKIKATNKENNYDVRVIVEKGLNKNISAYEALNQSGYIKNLELDFIVDGVE